ncbi:MAG: redoxin domain-containing protein [Phycisphaerae bacterium]
MKLRDYSIVLIAATLITATPLFATELGDPAPELKVTEWLKGEPVVLADGKDKNVYVIEIWATTCPHSCACIPYLTEMQKKYQERGVVFIALSSERASTLKRFVAKMGAKMEYRVAVDQHQATAKQYMQGFQVNTIPHTFLIDKSGAVVWHGHPMHGLEKALDAVLAGTYDIEARRRVEEARRLMPSYIQKVRSAGRADEAAELGEKIITYGQGDALLMKEFAWTIVAKPGLAKRDLKLAMRAAQTAYDACEGKDAGIVDTYARVLFETGKREEAVEYQEKAVKLAEGQEFQKELQETLDMYRHLAGE